jgi:hypothetical protein
VSDDFEIVRRGAVEPWTPNSGREAEEALARIKARLREAEEAVECMDKRWREHIAEFYTGGE